MISDFLVTFVFFSATVLALPLIFLLFLGVKICRKIWFAIVSLLHPDVEVIKSYTVRSLLDTHRNQGIVCVLLSIKGPAQPDAVRRHLHEVVNRRDKTGNLSFPKLRHRLVTRCGNYAWQHAKFDLDGNLIVAHNTFKGRSVTEYNIQEYVSQIVSKYLTNDISPWQMIIIPSSEDNHYILLKVHHLLLSAGMNIGDLLPLIPPTRQSIGFSPSKSPLVEVFKKPKSIYMLKEHLNEEISNRWNEFVANNDPLERPELLKTTPTFSQFVAFFLLTVVSLVKDCRKGFRVIHNDVFSRVKYILLATVRETEKRQINIQTLVLSILTSLHPTNIALLVAHTIWRVTIGFAIRIPILVYTESKALYACLSLRYCPYPHTFVGMMYTYIPLFYNSLKEIFYVLSIFFSAPKTIVQDILLQKESLQTITLCGRKSVAWSDPIKIETIKNVARQTGVSETEVMLSAVSVCLSKYMIQTENHIPTKLPITMRNISSIYIFGTGPNLKTENAVSGILCFNLSIPNSDKDNYFENLLEIKQSFSSSLEKQGLSHLLTLLQAKFGMLADFFPATFLAVYLKYLSRKYCVSVTELTSRYPNVTQKTLWGQEVNSVVYWWPPQANTSISLCLNEYADHVKLGVMCDSQLVPQHTYLVRSFPEFVQELGKQAVLT